VTFRLGLKSVRTLEPAGLGTTGSRLDTALRHLPLARALDEQHGRHQDAAITT
jgi:hypothetical protein